LQLTGLDALAQAPTLPTILLGTVVTITGR
jgi:hypothetical protein